MRPACATARVHGGCVSAPVLAEAPMKTIVCKCGPRGLLSALGLLLPLMAMVGCAPSQVRLSGQVMFEGVPLPGGLVTFRPVDPAQNSVAAEIAGQGNYEVTLPVGEVLV